MEFSFIIGVIGAWLIIALAKSADWFGGSGGHCEETDGEFFRRVSKMNAERDRKLYEDMQKKYH